MLVPVDYVPSISTCTCTHTLHYVTVVVLRIAAGNAGREFKQDQRPRARHPPAANARSARRVLQRDPDTRQEPRLPVHTAPAQRRKEQVRDNCGVV